jgi:hypothetical protein
MKRDPVRMLTQSDRAALQRMCTVLGIAWQGWRRVPWLRTAIETLATETEAARIVHAEGCSRLDAVERAALRAGVHPDTHRKRLDRARHEARFDLPEECADNLSMEFHSIATTLDQRR